MTLFYFIYYVFYLCITLSTTQVTKMISGNFPQKHKIVLKIQLKKGQKCKLEGL